MSFTDLNAAYKKNIFPIVEACLKDNSEDEFKNILKDTEELIGQKMSVCGIATGRGNAMKTIPSVQIELSETGFSKKMDSYARVKLPLLRCWLEEQSPQILELDNNLGTCPAADSALREHGSMRNVLSHGVLDVGQNYASYFDFINIPGTIKACHRTLAEILVPHLHLAYVKLPSVQKYLELTLNRAPVVPKILDGEETSLSTKEHEVLANLSKGKSNRDIGDTLNISEFTVKTHVQRIIKKLDATNRQHAVAKALELKLIYL